jgi:ketol-acid reductoisomerase
VLFLFGLASSNLRTQVPGKNLFSIEEALEKGTIIMNLLSDAAQSTYWPTMKPYLTKGKTLYFAHGFSVVYKEDTGVVPPKDIDVILVAPKGSGRTVRTLFKEGRGINASCIALLIFRAHLAGRPRSPCTRT